MGYGNVDTHRPSLFGSCIRIIDRELGQANNRFLFECSAYGRQVVPLPQDHLMVLKAGESQAAFVAEASVVLAAWAQMNPEEREDAWRLFAQTPGVVLWVERAREVPFLHDRGPDISLSIDSSLSTAAKVSRSAYDQELAQHAALFNWVDGLTLEEQDSFFSSYLQS